MSDYSEMTPEEKQAELDKMALANEETWGSLAPPPERIKAEGSDDDGFYEGPTLMIHGLEVMAHEKDSEQPFISHDPVQLKAWQVNEHIHGYVKPQWERGALYGLNITPPPTEWPEHWRFLAEPPESDDLCRTRGNRTYGTHLHSYAV